MLTAQNWWYAPPPPSKRSGQEPEGFYRPSSPTHSYLRVPKPPRLRRLAFEFGDYEFREADYQQILLWAKALGETAEKIIQTLESTSLCVDNLDDGYLISDAERRLLDELGLSDVKRIGTFEFNHETELEIG